MNLAICAGVGVGCGLLFLARSLMPAVTPITAVIDQVVQGAAKRTLPGPAWHPASVRARLAWPLADGMQSNAHLHALLASDVNLAATSWEEIASECVVSALGLGCLAPLVWFLVELGGISIPFGWPAWMSLVMGGAGAVWPFLALRRKAREKREHFRRALGSFLELVSLSMAGGMGVEGSLIGAAAVGNDWTFERIRAELEACRHRGAPPWEGLGRLGHDVGVTELTELAANLGLAGTEGARIRESLSAKASTLRRRELAEAEATANSMTEKMFLPGVFLLTGFLVFIGYPAIQHVFHSL